MAKARGTSVDVTELLSGLDKLLGGKESIARTMGAAMGEEVRDEAKERAPVLQPGNEGTDNQVPGLLKRSIYVAYDDRRRILNRDSYRYTVSWNSRKAPHGHLAEFGHWMPFMAIRTADGLWTTLTDKPLPGNGFFVQASPFLGPAFDAKLPTLAAIAIAAGTQRYSELMA